MLAIFLYVKYLERNWIVKLILSLFFSIYFGFKLNLLVIFKGCPECYGSELCEFFQKHQIHLTWSSFLLSLLNPNVTKSVFYGVFNESKAIVIKSKARRSEKFQPEENVQVEGEGTHVEWRRSRAQNVIFCPGFRDTHALFSQLGKDVIHERLWLDLETSIEPLLLSYFQSHGKWPVPKYYGACGDLIVEEYKGQLLSNFLSSSFETRVLLAVHLLKMAHSFTFQDHDFIFYFTDFSLYNLVVDSSGNLFLVDLDNVIIFDKIGTREKALIQNTTHTSQILGDDDDEYAFSSDDICTHQLSDHNYFSVCKYLLLHPQDGLLKEIPEKVLEKIPELYILLNECSQPKVMKNRISAGQELQVVLEKILGDYSLSKGYTNEEIKGTEEYEKLQEIPGAKVSEAFNFILEEGSDRGTQCLCQKESSVFISWINSDKEQFLAFMKTILNKDTMSPNNIQDYIYN